MKRLLLYYNERVFVPSELFLNKDFGQVALVLGEIYSYETEYLIFCKKINPDLITFSGKKVSQVRKIAQFLPDKIDFIKNIFGYLFLFNGANKYDALVMFPFHPLSDYFFLKLFKIFNKKANVIVKLDTNLNQVREYQMRYKLNKTNLVKKLLGQANFFKKILKMSDLIMYETIEAGKVLANNFLDLSLEKKLLNVYNGVSEKQVSSYGIIRKPYASRLNQIVVSGRIGAPQKNIEMIFKANPNLKNNWKIYFIGPIEAGFENVINIYKKDIPDFDDKFIFLGLISDKKKYYEILNNSKVLLLTSDFEGFPMVYSEALYFGLFIVTTNVSGSAEATNKGHLGKVIECGNVDQLKIAIESICMQEDELKKLTLDIVSYSKKHFIWESNLSNPVFHNLLE
jgi:glycosyltransferase involved in cell wall biosynthesis